MNLCTVKCPICGNWMSRTRTKRGKPLLYCGRCSIASMILKKSTTEVLDKACQSIPESELIPETLRKQRGQKP